MAQKPKKQAIVMLREFKKLMRIVAPFAKRPKIRPITTAGRWRTGGD